MLGVIWCAVAAPIGIFATVAAIGSVVHGDLRGAALAGFFALITGTVLTGFLRIATTARATFHADEARVREWLAYHLGAGQSEPAS